VRLRARWPAGARSRPRAAGYVRGGTRRTRRESGCQGLPTARPSLRRHVEEVRRAPPDCGNRGGEAPDEPLGPRFKQGSWIPLGPRPGRRHKPPERQIVPPVSRTFPESGRQQLVEPARSTGPSALQKAVYFAAGDSAPNWSPSTALPRRSDGSGFRPAGRARSLVGGRDKTSARDHILPSAR
jgi:hypothetical protein